MTLSDLCFKYELGFRNLNQNTTKKNESNYNIWTPSNTFIKYFKCWEIYTKATNPTSAKWKPKESFGSRE